MDLQRPYAEEVNSGGYVMNYGERMMQSPAGNGAFGQWDPTGGLAGNELVPVLKTKKRQRRKQSTGDVVFLLQMNLSDGLMSYRGW